MINKNLDDITLEDLNSLKENKIQESTTLDYKRELSLGRDKEKNEFLIDVSAFANTQGGDLIYGIEEKGGAPNNIVGMSVDDEDILKQQINSLIRDCLEPHNVRVDIKFIDTEGGEKVMILRVDRSWSAPHRVVINKNNGFYGRNSSGNYPMDTLQIKQVFNMSENLKSKIDNFIMNRIAQLGADKKPKVVLHMIPVYSLGAENNIDVKNLKEVGKEVGLKPLYTNGWSLIVNFDGIYTTTEGPDNSFVQVYRNGIIELSDKTMLLGPNSTISSENDVYLILSMELYLKYMKQIGLTCPILVSISFLGVKGYKINTQLTHPTSGIQEIDRDLLKLPEQMIESFDMDKIAIAKRAKPMFDVLRNACGFQKSWNYDTEGELTVNFLEELNNKRY